MRGLPPVPPDVLRLELEAEVNGAFFTTGVWLQSPDMPSAVPSYLTALIGSFELGPVAAFLSCMHNGSSFSTCRASIEGTTRLRIVDAFLPNAGAWTGGQVNMAACGLYVQTLGGGRGSGSRIRFPALPDIFVDDNRTLSATGVGNLEAAATALVSWVSTALGPSGLPLELGTVQRARGGTPLPASIWAPAVSVSPSFRVEYLARRMPKSRQISPP